MKGSGHVWGIAHVCANVCFKSFFMCGAYSLGLPQAMKQRLGGHHRKVLNPSTVTLHVL